MPKKTITTGVAIGVPDPSRDTIEVRDANGLVLVPRTAGVAQVPPGTPVTLDAAEADAIIARHGGKVLKEIPDAPEAAEAAPGVATSPDALADALAEVERLKGIITAGSAENAALVDEITAAETALEQAAKDLDDLRAALAEAETDKAGALAKAEAVAAELAAAQTDLAALTAPASGGARPAKPAK